MTKVPPAGTRLATAVVQDAIKALDQLGRSFAEDRNHVLRYPAFVLGGIASIEWLKEKGFKEADSFANFAIVDSANESRDLIEIILPAVGYSITALGLIFTGPIGLAAIPFMGVAEAYANVYLAMLRDREQDLLARAGVFRAQAEHWAESSRGERTAAAEDDLAFACLYALLGGIAAYIAGGGSAGLKKLIDATKELGSKAVAAGDKVMEQLMGGGEYGLLDTGGARLPAKIPASSLTNMESHAFEPPGNKLGTTAGKLKPSEAAASKELGATSAGSKGTGAGAAATLGTGTSPSSKGTLARLRMLKAAGAATRVTAGTMTVARFEAMMKSNPGVYVYRIVDLEGDVVKWGTTVNPWKRRSGYYRRGYEKMEVMGGPYARPQALSVETTEAATLGELGENIRTNTLEEMKGGGEWYGIIEDPQMTSSRPMISLGLEP
jgi:hypothetical protein